MILIVSFILLTAYAIGSAILGTDYLKWFFLGINYQNDINHKKRDERDKIIGTLILLMVNIIIIAFVL